MLVDDRPEEPERVIVEQTPDGILVSWSPVKGATEYQVIYDGQLSRMCHLGWPEQEMVQCQEAGRTTDTRFLHETAEQLGAKYYWVAACNRAGCRKSKSKGAEIGDPIGPTPQETRAAPTPVTSVLEANLTLSRQSVREGENFTATLMAQVPSGEPGTLRLRLIADGPLHVTTVVGQESCGPGCVSLAHKISGGERGSLSASFTAGQRGSARLRGEAEWKPDAPGESLEGRDEKTLTILARQDGSGPVIRSGGSEPPQSTESPVTPSSSGGCNSYSDAAGPGSLALLGLLILPALGIVMRPILVDTPIRRC